LGDEAYLVPSLRQIAPDVDILARKILMDEEEFHPLTPLGVGL
jgi:ribosomal 30S subunit maturation factor RimM